LILDRYISWEIAKPLLIFCPGLVFLFANFTAARYLSQVADGAMSGDSVVLMVLLKAAIALEVLLPIALHLSIVVALGRLYTDSEMTALFACGVSPDRIVRIVLVVSLVVAGLVAYLSVYVRPWANDIRYRLEHQAVADFDFNNMKPGRFYESSSRKHVIFFQHLDQQTGHMQEVFIQSREGSQVRVVSAKEAYYAEAVETEASRGLICLEAQVYLLPQDHGDLAQATTQRLVIEWGRSSDLVLEYRRKAAPTWQLALSDSSMDIAELQWRLSTPVATFLMGLLGFPLSRARARQGKYAKLFVAVLSYATFYNLNLVAKTWVEKGVVGTIPGIWWVHILLAILVAGLLWGPPWAALWQGRGRRS
jgi:lipopolysaccharide export system permease protein